MDLTRHRSGGSMAWRFSVDLPANIFGPGPQRSRAYSAWTFRAFVTVGFVPSHLAAAHAQPSGDPAPGQLSGEQASQEIPSAAAVHTLAGSQIRAGDREDGLLHAEPDVRPCSDSALHRRGRHGG
jgi:hypothetical protein